MRTRRFLPFAILAAAVVPAVPSGTASAADGPATHNMLVVGEEAVFLSHLPMFQERGQPPMPHRYQVILEVTFPDQERYAKDRREHPGTKIYMLSPETFVLPDLVATAPQGQPVRSFKALAVTRGHLERDDNVTILRDVAVTVKQVSHFRRFDPKAKRPPHLEYLLFGKGRELFLAHLIMAPPDFDQMLAVKVTGHDFSDDDLAKGVAVAFPGTKNAPASRLKEKQAVAGEAKVEGRPAPAKIQVEVSRELFFEEGELRVPPVMKTTTTERKAGFP
jgi:hypothetical protein